MNICFFKLCPFRNNSAGQSKYRIYCPFCKNVYYCSQKCRDMDWTSGHKNHCIKPQIYKKSQEPIQCSRGLQDFQIVYKNPQLGEGAQGTVRLVKDQWNEQLYAMKIIAKVSLKSNVKREIQIQQKLNHPNLIKLHYFFEDKEKIYLIVEYAEHGSFFKYLKRKKKLSEQEAVLFFYQICLGIQYLHSQNIIHRDLKPENILLDSFDNIKICDFGWSAHNTSNTERTTFCGTLDYLSPEMIQHKPHDKSLDIWCLGILLYEMLHGETPFHGRNEIEKSKSILYQQVEIDKTISKQASNLIQSMLRQIPNERLTIKEILNHPWTQQIDQIARKRTTTYYVSNNNVEYFNSTTTSLNQQEIFRKSKPSYESEKKEQQRSYTQNQSFFDKVLVALCCLKREQKDPQFSNEKNSQ